MKAIHKLLHLFQSLLLVASAMTDQGCINNPEEICAKPLQCREGDLTADPEDCGKFYQCDRGMWVNRDCAEGLAFNYEYCQIAIHGAAKCFDKSICDSLVSTPAPPIPGRAEWCLK